MYARLISVVVLAGCLHNPASSSHMAQNIQVDAKEVWKSYLQKGDYGKAASIALQYNLGTFELDVALQYARLDAARKEHSYSSDRYTDGSQAVKASMMEAYKSEANIACVFEPSNTSSSALVVKDIQNAYNDLSDNDLLYLLLDFDCPLSHDLRYEIITDAANEDNKNLDEFALRHALSSNWSMTEKMEFIKIYMVAGKCSFGLKAASQLGIQPHEMDQLFHLSKCEAENLDSTEWLFPVEEMRQYFFSTIRLRQYNFALEFSRLIGGTQDYIWYLIERAFAKHDEYILANMVASRPELQSIIFTYALNHGRARFVGMQAKEIIWQQRAFRKLIEEHQYDVAAEIAEFGKSPTFKIEGILTAFKATMADGKFEHGRLYYRERYPKIITPEEYDKATDAWFKDHPGQRRLPLVKKKKPTDPDCIPSAPGDWTVKKC